MYTRSLAEAEQVFEGDLKQFPETRSKRTINYLREE
jgi:hypothetical protein